MTGEDTETQTVLDTGVLEDLHLLLNHDDPAIRKETCWTLSNICAGTAEQVAGLIETGILDKLIELAFSDLYEIQRESGWSISNCTALKQPEIIQQVVERKGVEAMCAVLKVKSDVKTIVVLLEGLKNCLEVCKDNKLDFSASHPQLGRESTSGQEENSISIIIEECGGLDIIEDLQEHTNQHVYELAVEIIERFFQVEDIDLSNEQMNGGDMEFVF